MASGIQWEPELEDPSHFTLQCLTSLISKIRWRKLPGGPGDSTPPTAGN